MTTSPSEVITLVLRLWLETSEGDPPASEWRGEIKGVPSGHVTYFRGFDGMVERLRDLIRDERGPA